MRCAFSRACCLCSMLHNVLVCVPHKQQLSVACNLKSLMQHARVTYWVGMRASRCVQLYWTNKVYHPALKLLAFHMTAAPAVCTYWPLVKQFWVHNVNDTYPALLSLHHVCPCG